MQALKNLAGTGQPIPEPTSVEEVSGFLLRAEQQLVDASTASLSAASRFSLAYDAAHACALAALRAHGYRPGRGLGHRMVVFSRLPHTVASPAAEWAALVRYHTKRNSSEYAGLVNASDAEARDLIEVTSSLRDRVRAWLSAHRRSAMSRENQNTPQVRAHSPAGQQPQRFLDFFEMIGAKRAIAIHQPPSRDSADLVDQQIGVVFELAGFLHSYP